MARRKKREQKVSAFGEVKSLSEWVLDSRCAVPGPVLRERLNEGMEPERAITLGTFLSAFGTRRHEKIEAFGHVKTAAEWARDIRSNAPAKTILDRIRSGVAPEDAILRPSGSKPRKSSHPVTAFGETKSIVAWSTDPRCAVSLWTLSARLRAGVPPEQAITQEVGKGRKGRHSVNLEAFGETKSVVEWAEDSRCVVSKATLVGRLKLNWKPERALTTPPLKPKVVPFFIEAFGERKRIGAWSRDPRCSVSDYLIAARISRGMSPEEAISKGRTKRHSVAKSITAYGESKGIGEWAKDPRCIVKLSTLSQRIVRGMAPETAMSTSVKKRGVYRLNAEGEFEFTSQVVTAWGETKTAAEWAEDPRCLVTRIALVIRLRKGVSPEVAMTAKNPKGPMPPITAFGETKSGQEWKADPRLTVDYTTFCKRLRKGIDPESAMTAVMIKEKSVWLTAWGETKPAAEWSRDARCQVSSQVLTMRLREWPGAEHELIISAPPRFMYKYGHDRLIEGFSESKTLAEWLEDSRRLVPRQTVTGRVKHKWALEDAMTTPINARKRPGRVGNLHEAFGERKTLAQWAADVRCRVGRETLERRLRNGWEAVRAITSPRTEPGFAKGTKRKDSSVRFITAFGETKTTSEWADDPVCSVPSDLIGDRLRNGWSPENAISLPKGKGGASHTGVPKPPKTSRMVTAWGETKTLFEWVRDPRVKADNNQIARRLKLGWAAEDAMTRGSLPLGTRRDGSTLPPTPSRQYEAFGETKSIPEWSRDPRCVVAWPNLYRRVRKGWPMEQAITSPPDTSTRHTTRS